MSYDKFTPETRVKILEALRLGVFRTTACARARITMRTLQSWIERGERGEDPYASFLVDMQEVEAEVEVQLLGFIRNAEPGDVWQARAWILERKHPRRWAQRVRTAVAEEMDSLESRLRARLDETTLGAVQRALSDETTGQASVDNKH